MTETKQRGRKPKSNFYKIRWHTVGLNEERAAELLGVSTEDIRQWDRDGAPAMAERLLQLWDRKHIGYEGWDGWTFSRGTLRRGKLRWTPKMILEHRERAEEVFRLRDEIQELRTWRGLCTIFVDKLTAAARNRLRRRGGRSD
jgi:hypothetical protein